MVLFLFYLFLYRAAQRGMLATGSNAQDVHPREAMHVPRWMLHGPALRPVRGPRGSDSLFYYAIPATKKNNISSMIIF